jgi:hypothetical protein
MCSTCGGEHQLDALLAAGVEVGLDRARVAVEVLARAELQRVHEDRHDRDDGAGDPLRMPDQLGGGPRAGRPSWG